MILDVQAEFTIVGGRPKHDPGRVPVRGILARVVNEVSQNLRNELHVGLHGAIAHAVQVDVQRQAGALTALRIPLLHVLNQRCDPYVPGIEPYGLILHA